MGRNFIAEAQALATRAEACGFGDAAREVRDAIDYASTGGELMTGLRFHLRALEAQVGVPEDLRGDAKELADAINAVLAR